MEQLNYLEYMLGQR